MPKATITPIRRRPVRTVTVELEAEGYKGSRLEMRTNATLATWDQLDDMDNLPRVRRALAGLIASHNLVDEAGDLLELDESASQLNSEELWMVLGGYFKAVRSVTELPKGDAAS
jgi:hypothetical protein